MKTSNTAKRLKKIMNIKGVRQVDILEACQPYCIENGVKMNKSDLSQYVSGKTEPSGDKLLILSMVLNVSEPWLMGYDVPMEREVINVSDRIDEAKLALRKTTTFFDYLEALGYQVGESEENDNWVIYNKKEDSRIELTSKDMRSLENTTKENIELRLTKLMHDQYKPQLELRAAHFDGEMDEEQIRLINEDLDDL